MATNRVIVGEDGCALIFGNPEEPTVVCDGDRETVGLAIIEEPTEPMIRRAALKMVELGLLNGRMLWTEEDVAAESVDLARAILRAVFGLADEPITFTESSGNVWADMCRPGDDACFARAAIWLAEAESNRDAGG